ncbi:MAG: zinc-ribbon domain containing protein [Tepidiforma sp.]|nr:zinc-ribbon domain containing protein [Tepidiforma sp.]GIW17244.1 MAG: hypothetical protein KatS3mg064_0401 [Tepidiforma sp.]
MSFADKTLVCVDCSESFTFTAGEQEFHASKGFTQEPRRCPSCRRARKGVQGGGAPGADSRPPRQLYDAVCASCGKPAKVPFEPRSGRPVYCSDCFQPQPRGLSHTAGRPAGREPRSGGFGGGFSSWGDFEPMERGGGRGGRGWNDRKGGGKGRRW